MVRRIVLLTVLLAGQALFADGRYCFETNTFIFSAYYDDIPNPGYKFSFIGGRLRIELPELDISKIAQESFIRSVIDEPYVLERRGRFLYAALRDRKYLILSDGADVCVLVDSLSKDSFWGFRDNSPYVKLEPGHIRGNYVGIRGRLFSTLNMSSFLTENRAGKKIEYNMTGKYYFDLSTPWVEGANGYGIGEWLSEEIPEEINEILILNGFIDVTRPDLFDANTRVKRISISTGKGEWTNRNHRSLLYLRR